MVNIISRVSTTSGRVGATHSMSASRSLSLNGLAAGPCSPRRVRPVKRCDGHCPGTVLWKELRSAYAITGSPDFSPLRRFFIAAVTELQLRYDAMPSQNARDQCEEIRYTSSAPEDTTARHSPVQDFASAELLVDLPLAPVVTPVRSLTPANRSLRFLETGAPGSPLAPVLTSRAAVPGMCIASTDLLSFIDPLPMDRLALHDSHTVRDWPAEDRNQLLAVAHLDLHVARRNVADLTRYLEDQAAQLAMCAGAGEDIVPLMMMATFPRLTGGVREILDNTRH